VFRHRGVVFTVFYSHQLKLYVLEATVESIHFEEDMKIDVHASEEPQDYT
jgi:hypothetical protein